MGAESKLSRVKLADGPCRIRHFAKDIVAIKCEFHASDDDCDPPFLGTCRDKLSLTIRKPCTDALFLSTEGLSLLSIEAMH